MGRGLLSSCPTSLPRWKPKAHPIIFLHPPPLILPSSLPQNHLLQKKKVTFKVLRSSFNKLWKPWKVTGLSFPSPLPLTTAVATASNTAGQRGIAPPVLHWSAKTWSDISTPVLFQIRARQTFFYRQPVRLPHKLPWLLASSRLRPLIFVGTHWK